MILSLCDCSLSFWEQSGIQLSSAATFHVYHHSSFRYERRELVTFAI